MWRITLLLGFYDSPVIPAGADPGSPAYVVALSLISLALALMSVGLVSSWGVAVPSIIPAVGGRTLPVAAVALPGLVGGAFATSAALYAVLNRLFHFVAPLNPAQLGPTLTGVDKWIMEICRMPLLFSGALLLLVTMDYVRRRRRQQT